MEMLTTAVLAFLPAMVIVAALKDITSMTIPNWITLALIAVFPVAAFATGMSWMQIGVHVAVGVAALFIGVGMFALRWLGGGDAKVMAAICLWLGLTGAGPFVLWTAVAGGGLGITLLLARQHLQPVTGGAPGWVGRLLQPKGDIPYGVAICVGALIAWPASPMMTGF